MKIDHKQTLVLWADTGSAVGAGHLMRLVAIAQAWVENGGRALLLAAKLPGRMLAPHINGIEVRQLAGSISPISEQALEVAAIILEQNPDWIAIDGYRFDDAVERTLAVTGRPIMAMDDCNHASHLSAELVVFPHAGELAKGSAVKGWKTRYRSQWELAGLAFVPIRNEFRSGIRNAATDLQDAPFRIVVTMGGADPDNVTELACLAISTVRSARVIELDVILGPDYRHQSRLQRVLDEADFRAKLHVQIADPGRTFRQANLVVSAGGSTLYDLACLGVPAIAIETAENQRPVIRSMTNAKCAIAACGNWATLPANIAEMVSDFVTRPDQLRPMSEAGPRAVDGLGASRIVRRMMAGRLNCRPANTNDCLGLWRLRNEDQVRTNSCSTANVDLASHRAWLERVLADWNRHLFVLENGDGKIVGQCRMDIDSDDASGTISVSLTDEIRGCLVARGFVTRVVGQILASAPVAGSIRELVAWIRPENGVSRQLFGSLGYSIRGSENRANVELLKFGRLLRSESPGFDGGDMSREYCHAEPV